MQDKGKEKNTQKLLDINVANVASGTKEEAIGKEGNAEERTNSGLNEQNHSEHPVNIFASGLRKFGIGVLNVERTAVSGLRNFMRVAGRNGA